MMYRAVCVFVLFASIHLASGSDIETVIPVGGEEHVLVNLNQTSAVPESIVDEQQQPVDAVTEQVAELDTTATTTTTTSEEPVKHFLTQYSLNVTLPASSASSLSDLTFRTHLANSIALGLGDHEVVLIDKTDGSIRNRYEHATVIPVNEQGVLILFDDQLHELTIVTSTQQQTSSIPFKPKRIHIFSPSKDVWLAEAADEHALYISDHVAAHWTLIDNSNSATVLGWSNTANAVVLLQHARYMRLLDVATRSIQPVLSDVSATKLFSRYAIAKRSTGNDAAMISRVDTLTEQSFRALPKRLQSQGNLYCAVEDVNTRDLLLLFITASQLDENNQTIPSTCSLVGYAKQNLFNLSNIDCSAITDDGVLTSVECPTKQVPLYQVRGLPRSTFLANVAPGPTTVISYDGGLNWNRTHYECEKTIDCPHNASIVIGSLVSSAEAPGIVTGKATNGVDEYIAVSSDGGRVWRLTVKGSESSVVVSNPTALIVAIQNNTPHSFQYSTDYGRHWHEKLFDNDTSLRILSVVAESDNIFYFLTSTLDNTVNLLELNLNRLLVHRCARHQLKEWSTSGACLNGSKSYYQRRVPGSHCLNNATSVRTEPCACSLSDFHCLPGYRRSADGVCLPKSQYTLSQDCSCSENSTVSTKRRGYAKDLDNQCRNGVEHYLADTLLTRRDPMRPNFFLYGVDPQTKKGTVQVVTNEFEQDAADDEDDEEQPATQRSVWSIDRTYEVTAVFSDESSKQVYMAVEHHQAASIFRVEQNLRSPNPSKNEIIFDLNSELYRNANERIEHLTMDGLSQNLYVLVRNKLSGQPTVFILDTRSRNRRTIVKDQRIQPSVIVVDPIKAELYWITRNSPSILNIANLQGEVKRRAQLFTTESNVSYISYDPIAQDLIFTVDSVIYGLNTLDQRRLTPRVLYEHSSNIAGALFVHPVLYFADVANQTEPSTVHLHAIDILAKSYARNVASLKAFGSLAVLADLAPAMSKSAAKTLNGCAGNPCADLCIPLEHGAFRCVCKDNAPFQSCSCPKDEQFIAGSCRARNEHCAPGRVLCQNRIHCAETARLCEQDHTQYTETFKNSARCTLEQPGDGFDCYYSQGSDLPGSNHTCIPFEWLCDGEYDCPLGNDEEHCHKMTTTTASMNRTRGRCLTEQRYTHVMCGDQCVAINDVCQSASNAFVCQSAFHLHCQRTQEKNVYICKCHDESSRCIAMSEECDSFEHCEAICKNVLLEANSKLNQLFQSSSVTWLMLIVIILLILALAILILTVRYRRRRSGPSRTPAETAGTVAGVPPSGTRERLLHTSPNETS